ncbi:MAG: 6-bladed beta-propeller [Candidatus Tectomicrobia bacterium]|uniref:6-bladed beta-propeller n=1 Tax=Tectimicrobiota bacterium TaxID=2528274 RepID=A0A937W461_UNCTE|nr:6-bladed beta-propeller [Candidatus Tectomicrobia bacterium]
MSTHFFGIKDWTFSYSHSVGRNEFAGTGFRNPTDLALAANDVVYVVNRSYENRTDGIHITIATLNEEYIREFGENGEGDGEFIWPSSLALDAQGNVYVSDEWLNRISIFDKDGKFLGKWGKGGSGNGELNRPSGLAIANGSIFVSDTRNHRIQKFSLDGKYQSQFGSHGSGPGQLNMPWGLGLDSDGNIYVADWRNDRIQKFAQDGQPLASFGQSGSGVGQFKRPSGVCVDNDGDIYVADRDNDRVQVLAPNGRFISSFHGDHQLSKWGKEKLQSNPDMIRQRALAVAYDQGKFEKSFSHPTAVRVDDQQRVCVLDSTRGRIQVYKKSGDPVL